ncbi:MAG TPA: S41 family peptidase [Gammaproteobacteria bacterium]|nr:S41 family peptidase [Gammaproteobacteria bacterium]
MKFLRIAFVALSCVLAPALWAQSSAPTLTQPAISPDGSEIAFVSGGDIWSVPARGSDAHLLVSGMGNASRPLYSPNGKRLAFVSDKTGGGDIYVLDFASGKLTRITWADGGDRLSAWSRDGKWLYFDSSRDNIGGMAAVYRVRASGGTPMPVSLELYRNEEEGTPSPDGQTIALVGEGWGSAQWWRHGSAHIDHGAIWLLANDGRHHYRRITPDNARALWPMWSADGQSLFYMSDRSGTENIWHVRRNGRHLAAVTHFTNGRLLWPTISTDGRTIAFERGFGIWTLDTGSGQARPVPIKLRGAAAGPALTHKTFTDGFDELALSPDGKKLAFVVHGEVFAAPAKSGDDDNNNDEGAGSATRVTHTAAAEFDVVWAPDSRRIVYSSERGGHDHLFLYDFTSGKETQLTKGPHNDTHPQFSPNGKALAFLRDGDTLYRLDVKSDDIKKLVTAHIDLHHPLQFSRPIAWSPDGRYIAFLAWGDRMYRNAEVVPADGGKVRAVSFLGNTFADSIAWGPDGKTLYFGTGQRTEPGQVARIDLVPRTPKFREEQFLNLFEEETPPSVSPGQPGQAQQNETGEQSQGKKAKKKTPHVKIDFDHIARRLSLLPIGLNVSGMALSPDGKQVVVTATVAGRNNLYVYSLDEMAATPPVARQITATAGRKSAVQYAPDGKTIYYLDGGKAYSVKVKDGHPQRIALSAEMTIDFDAVKKVDFAEAWGWLKTNFHDPHMNGIDWNAVRKKYAPQIAGARTPAELHALLNRMVGELNASHSGVRGGRHSKPVTGRLGLRFDPQAYWTHGRFRIASVTPLSPAAVSGKIHVGDYLVAVDGTRLDAHTNLAKLLNYGIGHETRLRVAQSADGKGEVVKVKPVKSADEAKLAYDAWVEHNRAYVARISHGKLGYVHLPDMSLDSLRRLYRAINAQNATREGVVIDVRNNYGGFVNAYALDALTRRPYLNMTFRGMSTVNARPVLGQHALERPTALIANRITLSDGEDFTEGYRALGLGPVVGEPTAGWIIYTSNVQLIDGATVRLPFITVTDHAGRPMEQHPRPVDILVKRPLGESYRGKDSDLDAAVNVLLKKITGI